MHEFKVGDYVICCDNLHDLQERGIYQVHALANNSCFDVRREGTNHISHFWHHTRFIPFIPKGVTMSRALKVGDRVICKNADGTGCPLTVGRIYEVTRAYMDGGTPTVDIKDGPQLSMRGWYAYRFEPILLPAPSMWTPVKALLVALFNVLTRRRGKVAA